MQRWRALVRDAGERRREGRIVVEGPHLVAAALGAGLVPRSVLLAESGASRPEFQRLAGADPVLLGDTVFAVIADTESPVGIAAEFDLPRPPAGGTGAAFLDGIQDAGNVGTILRSAAAFGIGRVVLGRGCADPWSAKVLRAGMGAHFLLGIDVDTDLADALRQHRGPVACMVAHGGVPLAGVKIDRRTGWLLGAEGRGVAQDLQVLAPLKVTIPMAPGTESLNVAAAAAICFHAAFSTSGA